MNIIPTKQHKAVIVEIKTKYISFHQSPILKYTNPVFKGTSFLEAEGDALATINKTLSLLDVDSDSSHEEEEEIDNSALFVPQFLKLSIFYYDVSSATSSAMPAMMADVSSIEEQIANLTKLMEGLFDPIRIDVESSTNFLLQSKVDSISNQYLENFHIVSMVESEVHSNSKGWTLKDITHFNNRQPITLGEFFSKWLLNESEIMSCFDIHYEEKDTCSSKFPLLNGKDDKNVVAQKSAECMATITFNNDDLLLGSKPHNRTMFMSGFNQEEKIVLGTIRLDLIIDEMKSSVLLHVIDAKPSYNILLDQANDQAYFERIVDPEQGLKVEHGTFPVRKTEEGFDTNAYKLLAKAGYGPQSSNTLRKLITEVIENGYSMKSLHARLGYRPSPPTWITIKIANNHYTIVEDEDLKNCETATGSCSSKAFPLPIDGGQRFSTCCLTSATTCSPIDEGTKSRLWTMSSSLSPN
ncbi:hypothetical protein M9H77_16512 [Catharanthus roseus]|uniref:Uncharacterized protein n=1 Tax=Catharanthus roseus TaxID=4058 RepID=A0ACC0B1Z9_CATRO|nr:hypothetical protein M9H77_16512 [Catharanthus roseus]